MKLKDRKLQKRFDFLFSKSAIRCIWGGLTFQQLHNFRWFLSFLGRETFKEPVEFNALGHVILRSTSLVAETYEATVDEMKIMSF